MTKTNNFIEINGKRYDARSGAFLGKAGAAVTAVKRPSAVRPAGRGGTIDGFAPSRAAVRPKVANLRHRIKPLAAHHPEHAKTLRRDAVKSPGITRKHALKAQTPTDIVAIKHKPGELAIMPKLSAETVDPVRAKRAGTVPHSPHVDHFRVLKPLHRLPPAQTPVLSVQPQPENENSSAVVAHQARAQQPRQAEKKADVFEQAIAYAKSHEQLAPKESTRAKAKRLRGKHSKAAGLLASVALIVVLGSFIFWQNRADVELQLAAARSGVAASMPAYEPRGFAVKGLTYSPGTVTIGFRSPSNQNYSVVQKTSNWDSQTLLENYVAVSGQPYNAYQAAGRTVYAYGNGNATWVNGGVWYQVNDNGSLDKDQIINLATSM